MLDLMISKLHTISFYKNTLFQQQQIIQAKMPNIVKKYFAQNSPELTFKNKLSSSFKSRLENYCKTHNEGQIYEKIRAQHDYKDNFLENSFVLQCYAFINNWFVEMFYFPKTLSFCHDPFGRICHIQFENLKLLSISGFKINSIEPISWMNCPKLEKIILHSNQISFLKPISKANFKNLTYLDLRENKFNESSIVFLQRGLSKKFREKRDFTLFLTIPHTESLDRGSFVDLIKCSLRDFLYANRQRIQFEARIKQSIKSKNKNLIEGFN